MSLFFHFFLALLFLALYLTRFFPSHTREKPTCKEKKTSIAYNFCGKENVCRMLIIAICRALIAWGHGQLDNPRGFYESTWILPLNPRGFWWIHVDFDTIHGYFNKIHVDSNNKQSNPRGFWKIHVDLANNPRGFNGVYDLSTWIWVYQCQLNLEIPVDFG